MAKSKTPNQSKKKKNDKDYEVGYGKPPLHTRFKKGESGNRGGSRKKLVLLDVQKEILDAFLKKVAVREGNKIRWAPAITALVELQLNESLKSANPSATIKLLQLAREFGVFKVRRTREIDYSCLTEEERERVGELTPIIMKLTRHLRDPE